MIRQLIGDARVQLAALEPESVQCVVTSPPYYGLRSYLADGDVAKPFEIGLEPTPELFIEHLVEVFRGVRRVLRPDGCMFVNMGDSYAGSGKGPTGYNGMQNSERRQGFAGGPDLRAKRSERPREDVKPKDLMMMPARVAMALQADGWWLRSMIPWLKRNAMPESVTDRPATSVEYIFMFSKQARYFWDADAVRIAASKPYDPSYVSPRKDWRDIGGRRSREAVNGRLESGTVQNTSPQAPEGGRNRRNGDWFFESWQGLMLDEDDDPLALVVNPMPFKGSHFATFPPKLVEPMVKASTSERGCCPTCRAPWVREVERQKFDGVDTRTPEAHTPTGNGKLSGSKTQEWLDAHPPQTVGWRPSCTHAEAAQPVPCVVLDCFSGAGTVLLCADRLGRDAIGIDLKAEYSEMATDRLKADGPMFLELETPAAGVPSEPVKDKQGALGKRTYTGFNARWDAKEAAQ